MILGRVIGTLVSTRKEAELAGMRLLLVHPCEPNGALKGSAFVVAADAVGAGVGEIVLYVSGSSARQTVVTKDRPIDATIMAIVDLVEIQGEYTYKKVSSDVAIDEAGGGLHRGKS
jgi:microcompartment protein CcmK/EutM